MKTNTLIKRIIFILFINMIGGILILITDGFQIRWDGNYVFTL